MRLTQGGIGTLVGHRLKVDTAQADEGLFLVNATTGADITRITSYQKNKPGEFVWLNPASLPDAPIRLEVRARMTANGPLRTGALDSPQPLTFAKNRPPGVPGTAHAWGLASETPGTRMPGTRYLGARYPGAWVSGARYLDARYRASRRQVPGTLEPGVGGGGEQACPDLK